MYVCMYIYIYIYIYTYVYIGGKASGPALEAVEAYAEIAEIGQQTRNILLLIIIIMIIIIMIHSHKQIT